MNRAVRCDLVLIGRLSTLLCQFDVLLELDLIVSLLVAAISRDFLGPLGFITPITGAYGREPAESAGSFQLLYDTLLATLMKFSAT